MSDDPQLLDAINLEGWARLTLPCPGGGELTFNVLLDQMGIFPVVWGTLEACHYPDLSLSVSGALTLFMPNFAELPLFSRGTWGEDEANGMWFEVKGTLKLGNIEGQSDQILMIDTDQQIVRTLWETNDHRLILSIPDLDWSNTTLDDLEVLSVTIDTETSRYHCQLSEVTCTEAMNENMQ